MSRRLAALDLGSNSFHLLVADELPQGRIRRVTNRKLTLRLAEPVARTGALGEEARERAREAFEDLLCTARRRGAEAVAAVATSALREASDGARLCEEIRAATGVAVRVVDGLAEAYLSLQGMAGALRVPDSEPLLGLDLGGGSYEIAYGQHGQMLTAATLPLGAARVADRLRHDPPRFAECVALHADACAALTAIAAELDALRGDRPWPPRVAATAGTIRDLGRLGLARSAGSPPQRVRGVVVTREQLERAFALVRTVTATERMELPGVSAKRADLLPAGGVVLLATMETLGLEHLELSDWGLREGVLLDALSHERIVRRTDLTAP